MPVASCILHDPAEGLHSHTLKHSSMPESRWTLSPSYAWNRPRPTNLCLENSVHETSRRLIIAGVVLPRHQTCQAPLQDAVDDGRHEGYDKIEDLRQRNMTVYVRAGENRFRCCGCRCRSKNRPAARQRTLGVDETDYISQMDFRRRTYYARTTFLLWATVVCTRRESCDNHNTVFKQVRGKR